ncbi:MAG: energy transducer TonB [Acidobacteria bacterium]|nr:energy transducer TonB [Acidobacteriota bacterium]
MRLTKRLRSLLLLTFAALSLAPRVAAQEGARPTTSPYGATPSAWTRYTYPGEEFSVELPSAPAVSRLERNIPDTTDKTEQGRAFGLYSNGVVFIVTSYDRPRESETLDHFANLLWGGRVGLTAAGDVSLGGFPGRAYNLSDHPLKGVARVFRTQKHAYLLKAFSDEEGHGPTFERFVNSFTLGDGPAGKSMADESPARHDGAQLVPRASPTAGDGPYRSAELTRKTLIVFKPEPGYTERARMKNTSGVVRLRAVLNSSGTVTNISVVKDLPDGLTEMAVSAARRILFFPAVKDGRRVSQHVVLEYNFNLY